MMILKLHCYRNLIIHQGSMYLRFVKGLDMAAYWKLPCENFGSALAFPKDVDIERYVKERWPSEVEYSKARLYGQVATCKN